MTNASGYETLFSANGILVICYSVPDKIFQSKTKASL
jgi:hypothetical protein